MAPYVRPEFTHATTLFEKLFETDTPGVRGYKRLLEMSAVSEAGTPLLVRYIMIAFKDQRTKQWRVLDTGTDDSVDIDRQVAFFGQRLQDTQFTSEQENYLNYGHWLLLAGRIRQARQALTTALSASQYSNDPVLGKRMDTYFGLHRLQIQSLLTVIEKVTGKHDDVSDRMTQPAFDSHEAVLQELRGQKQLLLIPGKQTVLLLDELLALNKTRPGSPEIIVKKGQLRQQAAKFTEETLTAL